MINILVVDEERSYRELLAEVMSDAGYEVTTAGDAKLAKDLLRSCQPALVFVNPYMSGKEGFELLEQCRQNRTDTAIVVMVPQDLPNDDWLTKAEGYFVKGPDMEKVKQVAAEIVSGAPT
ncbi:MAG: response regulator [Thermodesulfobacteriota bacterium]|nr:response regulator [Thermodesulfobacteriota bacterium]